MIVVKNPWDISLANVDVLRNLVSTYMEIFDYKRKNCLSFFCQAFF